MNIHEVAGPPQGAVVTAAPLPQSGHDILRQPLPAHSCP